jgi:hypothetical protein
MAVQDGRFELFSQDEKGPLWRASFSDLESAKAKGQALADEEGIEFFVFDLRAGQEVARFFPKPKTEKG